MRPGIPVWPRGPTIAILAGVVSLLSISATLGGELLISFNSVVFALAPIMFAHIVVRTLTPPPARLPPPL